MGLTACDDTSQQAIETDEPVAIRLSATVSEPIATRATHSSSKYTTPTVVPGTIGVHFVAIGSAAAQSAYALSYTYTPNGSSLLLKSGTQPYFPNTPTGQVLVMAWYPESASTNGTINNFIVMTNQSDITGYTASDLMTASATASSTTTAGKTIPLDFKHQMAQLQVTFVNKSGSTVYPTITITDVYLDKKLTTKGSVIARTSSIENIRYDAVIPPQTIAADHTLITLTTSTGKKWTYVTPQQLTLKAGNSYYIHCTITADNASTGDDGAGGADPKTADAKQHNIPNA